MILLPRRSNIKPPVGVGIDWGHALSDSMVGCWLMNEDSGGRIHELVKNEPTGGIDGGSTKPTWENTRWGGRGLRFSGASSQILELNGSSRFELQDHTINYLLVHHGNTSYQGGFFGRSGNSSNINWWSSFGWSFSGGAQWFYRHGGTGWGSQSSAGSWNSFIGKITTVTSTYGPEGTVNYLNGNILSSSATYVTTNKTGTAFRFGKDPHFSTFSDVTIIACQVWKRTMSQSEARELYVNPYQMLEPVKRRLWYLPSGGGGGEFTHECSEALALTDQLPKYMTRGLIETLDLEDNSPKSTSRSFVEALLLNDTLESASVKVAMLTETLSLLDLVNKSPSKVLQEAFDALDTISRMTDKSLVEALTLQDLVHKSVSRTLEEELSLLDTVVSSLVLVKILEETLSFSDSVIRSTNKLLSELALFEDLSPVKSVTKLLTELTDFRDAANKLTVRELIETLSYLDNVTGAIVELITQILWLSEALHKHSVTGEAIAYAQFHDQSALIPG